MGEKAAFWLVVGGALVALGTFLPWVTLTLDDPAGSVEMAESGMMHGGGMLTLASGVTIALIGALASGNRPSALQRVLLWIALLVVMAVWIIEFQDIQNRLGLVDSEFDAGSIGHGMWVLALGEIAALLGTLGLSSSAEPGGGRGTTIG